MCSLVLAQEPAPTTRIVDRVDENNLVTLTGNTHPLARAQYDRGRVSADLPLDDLVLVLKRGADQQAAFDKFVASQSDPSSPNYHHWLEPEEVGERFGPTESDIAVIQNWLRDRGLAVGEVGKDRMTIRFSGTAAQVGAAFHTEIHNLDVRGEQHFANMTDPKIPAALAPVVAGPKALHNFHPHPLHRLGNKVVFNREKGGWQRLPAESASETKTNSGKPRPDFGINDPNAGLIEDVTPYDFAAIYNVTPSWNKGIDGTGQTIAIAGTSEINTADLATFRSQFGLPTIKSFSQVVANGLNPGQCAVNPSQPNYCGAGDQVENSLDVEWSGAVAKGASIVLVVSGENSTGSIDTVFSSSDYVVQNKTASILNVSYGLCELGEGVTGNKAYNNLWQTAASEGIAVFVATGDSGSSACDQGGDQGGSNVPYVAEYGLSVSGIASTPYNTAVGGTDLFWCDPITSSSCTNAAATYWNTADAANKGNAKGYIPEIPWDDTCVSKVGIEDAGYWNNQLYQNGFQVGNTPTDGEEACNFYVSWYQTIAQSGGPNLSFLVDTVGGGGGKSNCTNGNQQSPSSCTAGYAKPSWQGGVTGMPNDARRDIPDVSFFASSGFLGSAYLICVSANGACTYTDTSENTAQEIGGTSAASPAMAGVMALLNQKAGGPWGSPNSELYTLARSQNGSNCSAESVHSSSSCYFNDIDTQSNAQPCDWGLIQGDSPNCQRIHSGDVVGTLEGYSSGRGFDLATGLGSLNVANVVNAWPEGAFPAVSLSVAKLTFPTTVKGTESAAQIVTLKNTGKGALSLSGTGSGIAFSGTDATSFTQTNTCGTSVAVAASCEIKVVFKPAAAGLLTASLSIGDNATGSPQTVALSGTGINSLVKLSKTSVVFAGTILNKVSAPLAVTLQNTGTAALSIKGIAVSGTNPSSFHESSTCGTSVAAGKTCTIDVTFEPLRTGALSANIVISDGSPDSPQQIALSGIGDGPSVAFSKTSLTFPATTVGQHAAVQSFTLANTGNLALVNPAGGKFISIFGANVKSFAQVDTCGTSLAAGAKCTIYITFAPKKTGALSAYAKFADNAAGSEQLIKLSGAGD